MELHRATAESMIYLTVLVCNFKIFPYFRNTVEPSGILEIIIYINSLCNSTVESFLNSETLKQGQPPHKGDLSSFPLIIIVYCVTRVSIVLMFHNQGCTQK